MSVYINRIIVSEEELDELHHVNNVRYVQWVQDVAKAHWESKATKSIRNNYFWVMVRHCIDYKQSAYHNDTIRLETYVEKSEGIRSTRVVDIYNDKSNTLLARSETVWCLMDATTKRPTAVTDEIIALFS